MACTDYRCIGRLNDFAIEKSGDHDCRKYYVCVNEVTNEVTCPTNQYFNGSTCTSEFDETRCQRTFCVFYVLYFIRYLVVRKN